MLSLIKQDLTTSCRGQGNGFQQVGGHSEHVGNKATHFGLWDWKMTCVAAQRRVKDSKRHCRLFKYLPKYIFKTIQNISKKTQALERLMSIKAFNFSGLWSHNSSKSTRKCFRGHSSHIASLCKSVNGRWAFVNSDFFSPCKSGVLFCGLTFMYVTCWRSLWDLRLVGKSLCSSTKGKRA